MLITAWLLGETKSSLSDRRPELCFWACLCSTGCKRQFLCVWASLCHRRLTAAKQSPRFRSPLLTISHTHTGQHHWPLRAWSLRLGACLGDCVLERCENAGVAELHWSLVSIIRPSQGLLGRGGL